MNEKVDLYKGEDCIDKQLTHIKRNWKSDPKIKKKGLFTRYNKKIFAHKAVRFDN